MIEGTIVDGAFTAVLDPALTNGEEVSATLTDDAGNVSDPGTDNALDITAPDAPTVIIGNGDDLVNGFDLNDNNDVIVSVILPINAVVGDTLTVNGADTVINQDMIDNGYDTSVPLPAEGETLTVTANVTDQAGNVGLSGTNSATVGNIMAPAVLIPEALDGVNAEEFADGIQTQVTLPDDTSVGDIVTLTVTPDGGTPITIQYEVTAADLDVNGGNGIAEITIPNGAGGISDNGAYTVVATVTDADNNVGVPSDAVGFDLNTTFAARDDSDALDLGQLQVTYYAPVIGSDLVILGALEGNDGANSSLGFTVNEGTSGTVNISVQQTALVAVADAVNIEVYNSNGDLVYVGTTGGDPLVGDVIGIELLGLTGNDTLTATISGLEPDDYTIVVRNDRSALEALVDDITLAELGQAGVVLGPDNQEAVFAAIEDSLGSLIGGTVNSVLGTALSLTGELGAGEIVSLLQGSTVLNTLLGGVIDPALDAVAEALLSNTLTLLETTDITATVTEFDYADDTVINGNVIDPDASILGESGEDTVTPGTTVTDIDSSSNQLEPTSAVVDGITVFTIQGQYGVLVIGANGNYTYTANGDFASLGQSETFTYTVSDGVISDTAELVIELDDLTPPPAPTINTPIAGDNVVNSQEAADGFNITGTGEVGAIITLTDATGDVIGTATVGTDRNWSVLVDQADVDAMDEGLEEISATARDSSGNVSGPTTVEITVDTEAPIATDDQNYAGLEVDPLITNPTYSGSAGGLLNLNALGGLTVSALSNAAVFDVTVTADQQLSLTLDGNGSVTAVVGSPDLNLLVYPVNNETGDIILFDQHQTGWTLQEILDWERLVEHGVLII